VFDITTIIVLAIAVLIFLKLRSVLGQRTGRERPPYDPYSVRRSAGDKVVALPGRTVDTPAPTESVRPVEATESGASADLRLTRLWLTIAASTPSISLRGRAPPTK
jgi:predicted lipid-binding transport protein (Tim44 family)